MAAPEFTALSDDDYRPGLTARMLHALRSAHQWRGKVLRKHPLLRAVAIDGALNHTAARPGHG